MTRLQVYKIEQKTENGSVAHYVAAELPSDAAKFLQEKGYNVMAEDVKTMFCLFYFSLTSQPQLLEL